MSFIVEPLFSLYRMIAMCTTFFVTVDRRCWRFIVKKKKPQAPPIANLCTLCKSNPPQTNTKALQFQAVCEQCISNDPELQDSYNDILNQESNERGLTEGTAPATLTAISRKEAAPPKGMVASMLNSIRPVHNVTQRSEVPLFANMFHREALSLIVGESEAGKTWITLLMAYQFAMGERIWGQYEMDAPGRVLFLMGDKDEAFIKNRLHSLQVSAPDSFQITSQRTLGRILDESRSDAVSIDLRHPDHLSWIEKMVLHTKADLVIIDTLGSWMDGNESTVEDVRPMLRGLRAIAERSKAHISILHHLTKPTDRSAIRKRVTKHDVIGSSFLTRYVDEAYSMTPDIDEETGENMGTGWFRTLKTWYTRPRPFKYQLEEGENNTANITCDFTAILAGSKQQMVINHLHGIAGEFSKQDIIQQTSQSPETVKKALHKAKQANVIQTVEGTKGKATRYILTTYASGEDFQ